MDVAAVRPNEYFVPTVIEYVRESGSFDGATQVGELLVVPHAPYLSLESLEQVLDVWAANSQCVGARRMPGLAVELFAGTAHLGQARLPAWQKFVDTVAGGAVASGTERDPWFNYQGIDQALAQAAT